MPHEFWLHSGHLSSTTRTDTGYIEFVAVAERARRQGIATRLVEDVIAQTRYTDFELEVTDVNVAARDCYRRIGFVDVNRKKEKFGRIKGFRERIYMHYTREPSRSSRLSNATGR